MLDLLLLVGERRIVCVGKPQAVLFHSLFVGRPQVFGHLWCIRLRFIPHHHRNKEMDCKIIRRLYILLISAQIRPPGFCDGLGQGRVRHLLYMQDLAHPLIGRLRILLYLLLCNAQSLYKLIPRLLVPSIGQSLLHRRNVTADHPRKCMIVHKPPIQALTAAAGQQTFLWIVAQSERTLLEMEGRTPFLIRHSLRKSLF